MTHLRQGYSIVKSSGHSQLFVLVVVAGILLCCLAFLVNSSESEEEHSTQEGGSGQRQGVVQSDPLQVTESGTLMDKAGISIGKRVEAEWKGDWYVGTVHKLPDVEGGEYSVQCDFLDGMAQVTNLRPLKDAVKAKCFCGNPYTEECMECNKCGRPRHCACGNPFNDDSVFCRKCGKPRFEPSNQEDPIRQVEFSDGSWARAYREARGQRREALELLFRCNIISTQEFAYSRVSQEHIDECVWIGIHMLKEKPLDEWVALWQMAQQTFEDSVTACFSARTDARSTYGVPPSGPQLGAPRSEVPMLDCLQLAQAQSAFSEDQDDPYTTRSSQMSQMMSPSSDYMEKVSNQLQMLPETSPSACVCGNIFMDDASFCRKCGKPKAEVAVMEQKLLQRSIDRSSMPTSSSDPARILSPMILRCSEIMAAPPQEGVPAQQIPQMPIERASSGVPRVDTVQQAANILQSMPEGGPAPATNFAGYEPQRPTRDWQLPSLVGTPAIPQVHLGSKLLASPLPSPVASFQERDGSAYGGPSPTGSFQDQGMYQRPIFRPLPSEPPTPMPREVQIGGPVLPSPFMREIREYDLRGCSSEVSMSADLSGFPSASPSVASISPFIPMSSPPSQASISPSFASIGMPSPPEPMTLPSRPPTMPAMATSESIGKLSAMSLDSDMPTLVQLHPDYPVPNSGPIRPRAGSMTHIGSSDVGFSTTPPEPVNPMVRPLQQGQAPLSSGEVLAAHLPLSSNQAAEGSMHLSPLLQPSMKELIKERMSGKPTSQKSLAESMKRQPPDEPQGQ